jgi:hypothetical protein
LRSFYLLKNNSNRVLRIPSQKLLLGLSITLDRWFQVILSKQINFWKDLKQFNWGKEFDSMGATSQPNICAWCHGIGDWLLHQTKDALDRWKLVRVTSSARSDFAWTKNSVGVCITTAKASLFWHSLLSKRLKHCD